MANFYLPKDSDLALAARGWPGSGVKPSVSFKVKSEWLDKGLTAAWVFGPDGPVDIAFNRTPTVGSGVTFGGDYAQTDGTASGYLDLPVFDSGQTGNYTFVIDNERISGVVNWSYLHPGTAWTGIYQQGTEIKTSNSNSFDGSITPVGPSINQNCFVVSHAANDLRGTFNGGAIVTDATAGLPWAMPRNYVTFGGNRRDAIENISVTKIRVLLAFDRVLSDADKLQLSANSFEVFEPANQTPYLYSVSAGGGAENYERTLASSLPLYDAAVQRAAYDRVLADSTEFTDSILPAIISEIVRSLSDSLTVTDSADREALLNRALVQSLSLTDTVALSQLLRRSLSSSFDLTDSLEQVLAGLITRVLSDAVTLSDVIARTLMAERRFSDTVEFSDLVSYGITGGLVLERLLADGFDLTDTLLTTQSIERLLVQTVALTDEMVRIFNLTRGLADNLVTNDQLVKAGIFTIIRTLADSLELNDSQVAAFIAALGEIGFIEMLVEVANIDTSAEPEAIEFKIEEPK